MTPDQRLLLVHAHPDDESIGQGATMAKYVAEGRGVTLVTCTAGELGEILVPELEHLSPEQLAEHRRGELEDAMKCLGVTDHRFLGGFGTYRDSGMKWHEDGHAVAADDVHENAFWHADLTQAADHLVQVIREVRPQVMVTYDQFGGYGHPDHTRFDGMDPDVDLPLFVVPDEYLTAAVDAQDHIDKKMDALRAHATQI